MSPPRRTLIVVPGLDGTGIFFAPFIAALPPWLDVRVFAFNALRPQSYAELLAAFEPFVAQTPDCHLLAWSYSGPLAVMLAQRQPQLRSLTLASSFLRNPRPELRTFLSLANAPVIGALRTLRRLPVWLGRRTQDPYRQAKAQVWKAVSARDLATRLRTLPAVDVRARLAQTRVPLLCLTAQADRVVPPPATIADIRAARPDAAFAELPGPHFAVYFEAARAARCVANFVAGVEGY